VVSAYRNVALGEPLEKDLRSLGILIQERGCGGEQQDHTIARLRAHCLFGLG